MRGSGVASWQRYGKGQVKTSIRVNQTSKLIKPSKSLVRVSRDPSSHFCYSDCTVLILGLDRRSIRPTQSVASVVLVVMHFTESDHPYALQALQCRGPLLRGGEARHGNE